MNRHRYIRRSHMAGLSRGLLFIVCLLSQKAAFSQITYDVSSAHVYAISSGDILRNAATGNDAFLAGTITGNSDFSGLPRGVYRMTGASNLADSVPIGGATLSTASGLTIRLIVQTTTPADPGAHSLIWLTDANGQRSLVLGHDSRTWMFARTQNPSPYNSILQRLFLWLTPWDPVYDQPGATVIFYLRVSSTGVAYLDRFMPYYSSDGQAQISWEEGVQLGALNMDQLGIGTETANPPAWSPITFSGVTLGASDPQATASDIVRDISIKSASVDSADLLKDVSSLVPSVAPLLATPNLVACNDGQWLDMNQDPSISLTTPCGPFFKYPAAVTDGLHTVHFGPPPGRTSYTSGRNDLFLPPAPGSNVQFSANNGVYSLVLAHAAGVDGYNYAVYDTSTTPATFVQGTSTSDTAVPLQTVSGGGYQIKVAAYNAMGTGASSTYVFNAPVPPDGFQACSLGESEACNYSTSGIVAYGYGGYFYFKTVTGAGSLSCNSVTFGGTPAPGEPNACFFLAGGQIPTAPPGFSLCATGGNGICGPVTQPVVVAYGANGKFYFQSFTADAPCNNATFQGDPAPGLQKYCFFRPAAELPAGPPRSVYCASEGGNCDLPVASPVSYGAAGTYYTTFFQQGASVQCSVSSFGHDPAQGWSKACFYFPQGNPINPAAWVLGVNAGTASFPQATDEVWYGAGTNFVARPFLNAVQCSPPQFLFDPNPGYTNACYISDAVAPPITPPGPPGFTYCSPDQSYCFQTIGNGGVAYGAEAPQTGNSVPWLGSFATIPARDVTTSPFPCLSTYFWGSPVPDPAPGINKSCFFYSNDPGTFPVCASQGGTCQLSAPSYVARGTGGYYTIRKFSTNIVCNDATFGTHFAGSVSCYLMAAPPPGQPAARSSNVREPGGQRHPGRAGGGERGFVRRAPRSHFGSPKIRSPESSGQAGVTCSSGAAYRSLLHDPASSY